MDYDFGRTLRPGDFFQVSDHYPLRLFAPDGAGGLTERFMRPKEWGTLAMWHWALGTGLGVVVLDDASAWRTGCLRDLPVWIHRRELLQPSSLRWRSWWQNSTRASSIPSAQEYAP